MRGADPTTYEGKTFVRNFYNSQGCGADVDETVSDVVILYLSSDECIRIPRFCNSWSPTALLYVVYDTTECATIRQTA